MEGVILRFRPGLFRGALGVPKKRVFQRMARTERGVHPAASAISVSFDLLGITIFIILSSIPGWSE